MKNQTELKAFAARKLAVLYETNDYAQIHEHLGSIEPSFKRIPSDKFGLEYLAACLALASLSWAKACRENKAGGKENENILFRILMESFGAPKFLNLATAFSVYLHSPPSPDEKVVLSVMRSLMERLNLKVLIETEMGLSKMHDAFKLLVEAGEGLRSSFENDFFEFVHS